MRATVNLILAICVQILFHLIWDTFTFCQLIIWRLTAIHREVQHSKLPENYRRSAHVLRVRWRHFFSPIDMPSLRNFILTHERFEDPRSLLKKRSVSLYFLTEDTAVFCDSGEDEPLWKFHYGEFFRNSAADLSKYLIVVPLKSLHKMAQDMGTMKNQLVFLTNTMRCGSTLLCKMIDRSGSCRVIPEPEVINQLCIKYELKRGETEYKQLKELCRDVIKVLCKPDEDGQQKPDVPTVIKVCGSSSVSIRLFLDTFPKAKCMFLYRNLPQVCRSVLRMCQGSPTCVLAFHTCRFSSSLTRWVMSSVVFPTQQLIGAFQNEQEYGAATWVIIVKSFLELSSQGYDIPAFRYEDLVSRPREVLSEVFSLCGINTKLVADSARAMENYSQTKSYTRRENLDRFSARPHQGSEDERNSFEKVLRNFGLHPLDKLKILPNNKCASDDSE